MKVVIDHFDIANIADSGQCFRYRKVKDNEYFFIAYGKKITVRQEGDTIDISCTEEEWKKFFYSYFDLDTDYAKVEKLIADYGESHLIESFEKGKGIRILKQDLWETIISFMISQNNNIPRIKCIIERLCTEAGKRVEGEDDLYAFPGTFDVPEDFFDTHELGLGYRAPYLKEMFSFVSQNPQWLDYLKTLSYEEARKELLSKKGIGPKVADCICLFGLHHIDAFPIDTHVKDLLCKYYPNGSLDLKRFEGYAGIIQQYLFYYEIM